MAEHQTDFFLRSHCQPGELYSLRPPSPSDDLPWSEADRSAFDYLVFLASVTQNMIELGRKLRGVKELETDYKWLCDNFRNAKKIIRARLAAWQSQTKGQ